MSHCPLPDTGCCGCQDVLLSSIRSTSCRDDSKMWCAPTSNNQASINRQNRLLHSETVCRTRKLYRFRRYYPPIFMGSCSIKKLCGDAWLSRLPHSSCDRFKFTNNLTFREAIYWGKSTARRAEVCGLALIHACRCPLDLAVICIGANIKLER